MTGKGIRFLRGYVHIRLISREPERFLYLCGHAGVELWDLLYGEHAYEFCLSVPDFFRLQPYCRKTGSRVLILKKYGMPFFLHRNRKRKAFFLGIFLAGALLFLLSGFIWNIHIEGNHANTTREILNYLETLKIVHGTPKSTIDCPGLAAELRREFPDMIWVSAKIQGTRLILEIKENEDSYEVPSGEVPADAEAPTDLIATKDGIVQSVVTRRGTPQALPGSEVKKGDVLVSGMLEITDDSGEVASRRYVAADADIRLVTQEAYEDSFRMEREVRVYQDENAWYPVVRIFDWQFHLGFFTDRDSPQDKCLTLSPVHLTENFVLPLSLGKMEQKIYRVETREYSEEEARDLARQHLEQYCEKLEEQDIKVLETNVETTVAGSMCTSRGTLTLLEEAVTEQPCQVVEEQKETEETQQ